MADDEPARPDVSNERARATGDLDRVTDYVEEREIDVSGAADRMRAVLGSAAAARKRATESESRVKISPADVQAIVDELEIDAKVAERALRDARGDVVKALCALVR